MVVIILLTVLLVGYGVFEYAAHRRRVYSIPIRVHVNGTRGKSSVTRLVAAGLRAGGLKTLAKVTGTLPRIIDEHGLEIPITRLHPVNIIEQVKVFRFFDRHRPEAVVVECMAVMPDYQWICEHRFVHATAGVITNARMDHVREMGPSLSNIANSLANTIPKNAPIFTSDYRDDVLDIFRKRAEPIGSKLVRPDTEAIGLDVMRRFSYIEHPDNVALALEVCEFCGVDRNTALNGMVAAHPDPGALKVFKVQDGERQAMFLSALAANDPESTLVTWRRSQDLFPSVGKRIVLLNTRGDRFDRSVQLVEMMGRSMEFDLLLSMGESTEMLAQRIKRSGISANKVKRIGHVSADKAWDIIWSEIEKDAFIFAMGNAGHGGLAVADLFRKRRVQNG
ncbi:poly-gamma-glutamate synthase PgsB [bacterium]|nr:poly-gamma-glutamate synthase PgsB [bacterium]